MFVLGIDPGLTRTGYGIIESTGSTEKAVAAGVIRTDPAQPLGERFVELARDLREIVAEYEPQAAAIEQVFVNNNRQTAMSVARASGIALAGPLGSPPRDRRIHSFCREDGAHRLRHRRQATDAKSRRNASQSSECAAPRRRCGCARRGLVPCATPGAEREGLMIGRLSGTLASVGVDTVLIDVNGVGYDVAVSSRTFVELSGVGSEIVLHTHLHVREDQMALFGFTTSDDRDLFRLLLGVSGIGPKVGLAILATMSADDLRRVVVTDDVAALTAVPGIGKRSAQKLLLELRPKLEVADSALTASGPLGEVRTALEGLGYQSDEISGALRDLPPDLPVEEMLRRSLQALGKRSER